MSALGCPNRAPGVPADGRQRRDPIGTHVAVSTRMLKLIGSAVLARVLGFGIVGFIVIYLLLTMLS
jgi:hypothetical protein